MLHVIIVVHDTIIELHSSGFTFALIFSVISSKLSKKVIEFYLLRKQSKMKSKRINYK